MNNTRWDRMILPIAGLALGVFLVLRPWSATAALCSFLGWLILLVGAVGVLNALAFQRATMLASPLLPFSVGGVAVGLFFILSPDALVALVGMIVCVLLLVAGVGNLQAAALRNRLGDSLWWLPAVTGVLCVVLGLYALFYPGASAVLIMRLIGTMLVVSNGLNLLQALTWRDL